MGFEENQRIVDVFMHILLNDVVQHRQSPKSECPYSVSSGSNHSALRNHTCLTLIKGLLILQS